MTEDLDLEFVEAEFGRWVDENDIDDNIDGLDENDLGDLQRNRARIIKGIQKGRVVVDEAGLMSLLTREGKPERIVFKEPKGSAYSAMDKRKKAHDVGKMFASMADMCGINATTFVSLPAGDVKLCISVWSYFLV